MTWTIYHNESCSKSRAALSILNEHGIHPQIIDYKKTGLKESEVLKLIEILKVSPKEIIRSEENNLETKEQIAKAINLDPSLLQRPIVLIENTGIIARPPENVLQLINTFK
jgi:arsenate reductase